MTRYYKSPPFHTVIRIHLISLSYHILVFLPSHFSSMEQMLMIMLIDPVTVTIARSPRKLDRAGDVKITRRRNRPQRCSSPYLAWHINTRSIDFDGILINFVQFTNEKEVM